ncbi:hypothetical protein SK128_006093 [Halocaridina rubra]|uniref:C2H2-type domain-containing protein n=1 Tax=Halocaridina rubra TaxID=373956 RepID=A0AAN9ABM6_HALRR
MESNNCVYCGKEFANKYTKKRHLVTQHGEAPQVKPKKSNSISSSLLCRFCKQVSTNESNRKRHETIVHGTHIPREPPVVPTAINCKGCGEEEVLNFTSLRKYREHLQQHHGIPTRKVDYEFSSTHEFMVWKDRLEADVGVKYSKRRGVQKSITGTRSTYYCSMSGLQRERVQSSKAKRAKKGQGTCKLGLYCTSSMEVMRRDDDVIHVSLYTDHRDHDLGFPILVHTTFTKSKRERIAEENKEKIKDNEKRQERGKKRGQKRRACEIPNESTGESGENTPKKKAKIKAKKPHEESNSKSKNEPSSSVRNHDLCETTFAVNPQLADNTQVEILKPKSQREKKSHLVKSKSSDKVPVVTSAQSNATTINPGQFTSNTATNSTKSISGITVNPGLCNSGLIFNPGQVPSGIVIRPNKNSINNVLLPGQLNAGLVLIRPQLPTCSSEINSGQLHQGLQLIIPTVSSTGQVVSLGQVSKGVTVINPTVGAGNKAVNPTQATKTLTTVAGKMPLLTTPSAYSVQVNNMQNKITKLQRKVKKLSRTVHELHDEIAYLKDTTICRNLAEYQMQTKMECLLRPLFTKTQIKAIIRGQTISQWPDDDIMASLKLYNMSRKCYRYLKYVRGFPLPSLATLKKRSKKVLCETGAAEEIPEPENAVDDNPCALDNVLAVLESDDEESSDRESNNTLSNCSQSNVLGNNSSESNTLPSSSMEINCSQLSNVQTNTLASTVSNNIESKP